MALPVGIWAELRKVKDGGPRLQISAFAPFISFSNCKRPETAKQKEIKLLASDPPPGVSLSALSEDAPDSFPSLTSIDACIQGSKGTVCEQGVFNIKIQIPDRYPFQPPSVTFATSIYHPNIDNGGHTCLDILNFPPKGAWVPSLSISTVLTSIGLLLMEPNPDDGLMCEASREYKYNRLAFDEKAWSWTLRFAKPVASGSTSSSCVLSDVHSSGTQNMSVGLRASKLSLSQTHKVDEQKNYQSQDAEKASSVCCNKQEQDSEVVELLSVSYPKHVCWPPSFQVVSVSSSQT